MTHAALLRNALTAPSEALPGLVGRTSVELGSIEGEREWLSTNANGSFALGSVDRGLRRKYDSILTVRAGDESRNLVADVLERAVVDDVEYTFLPVAGDGGSTARRAELQSFVCREHPTWVYELGRFRLRRELVLEPDTDSLTLRYELAGPDAIDLALEPLLLFRSLHAVAKKDLFLDGRVRDEAYGWSVAPYARYPRLHFAVTGARSRMDVRGVFRELTHEWEGQRGYERGEFAFVPGRIVVRLTPDEPLLLRMGTAALSARTPAVTEPRSGLRGGSFRALLERAASAFVVRARPDVESGPSVVAGYPWFGGSLRQTLLALPGLVAPEKGAFLDVLEAVGAVLSASREASREASRDEGVDVPLLFIRAVQIAATASDGARIAGLVRVAESLLLAIVGGQYRGLTLAEDGLLFVTPGPWALTWMNAKVDGLPVTARSGYAVDVNALYVDALAFLGEPWSEHLARARSAFVERFWSSEYGFLADCHDGTTADFSLRPNQLWAAALPHSALSPEQRLAVVDSVKAHLLTDVGIRTLAPYDRHYMGYYEGGVGTREAAAHQGSAWPFLVGLYADALLALGETERLREDLLPILERLHRHARGEACLGQISELFDGEAPHEPRGAPAHAANVAELLRVVRMIGPEVER